MQLLSYTIWLIIFFGGFLFVMGVAGLIRYWCGIGMKLFVVQRDLLGNGWQENCGEVVYRAFNEKHLRHIFKAERRQFVELRLRCRLEHRLLEEE